MSIVAENNRQIFDELSKYLVKNVSNIIIDLLNPSFFCVTFYKDNNEGLHLLKDVMIYTDANVNITMTASSLVLHHKINGKNMSVTYDFEVHDIEFPTGISQVILTIPATTFFHILSDMLNCDYFSNPIITIFNCPDSNDRLEISINSTFVKDNTYTVVVDGYTFI